MSVESSKNGEPRILTRPPRRRQPKTSEVVAREIARQIIDNDLEPGAMLETERQMVESCGVGRSTLREALLLLETRGVITIKAGPRGGPVVRRPHASDFSESLTLILEFEKASLREVLEAREALEPMLARLVVRHADDRLIESLQGTVEAILGNIDDHETFLRENERFHALLAEGSGNIVLQVFAESVKSIADGARAGVSYPAKRRKAVAQAHQRIVDALRAKDEDAAVDAVSIHLSEAGRYWERKYSSLVSSPVRWGD